jgi:hypothetical protein
MALHALWLTWRERGGGSWRRPVPGAAAGRPPPCAEGAKAEWPHQGGDSLTGASRPSARRPRTSVVLLKT